MPRPRRLLFVCLGNIVRSPLAENIFRQNAAERNLGGTYQVDSAGTTDYHLGEPPDPRMQQEAAKHGLRYSGRSRPVSRQDFDRFDFLFAMDRQNYFDLIGYVLDREQYKDKIYLLREFDPQADGDMDIPDPYYGGKYGFTRTYEIVERSVLGLLNALETGKL